MVYEVVFCRETIMICSSMEKAKLAVIELMNRPEFRGFRASAFSINTVKLDTYYEFEVT